MATDTDSVHYVMILQIEKVIKSTPRNHNSTSKAEPTRTTQDVAKIVISDSSLDRLLDRGARHMALVQDEEVDITKTKSEWTKP